MKRKYKIYDHDFKETVCEFVIISITVGNKRRSGSGLPQVQTAKQEDHKLAGSLQPQPARQGQKSPRPGHVIPHVRMDLEEDLVASTPDPENNPTEGRHNENQRYPIQRQ